MSTDPVTMAVALKFMGIGVAGVFVVLAIFYGVIKLLLRLLPSREKSA